MDIKLFSVSHKVALKFAFYLKMEGIMKIYKVTMFRVVGNHPEFYSINVACKDVATEIWLNPNYKNVWDVTEIS